MPHAAGAPAIPSDRSLLADTGRLRDGVELEAPVLGKAGREANFTNEGGVDGRVRYLRNVMGLWLLSESIRSIFESLAAAYARTLPAAAKLSGKEIRTVHIIGGGSQNQLLCQLTADRAGLPVLAGPVDATAIGNVIIQARAQGLATGSLESLRALVARSFTPIRYTPRRLPAMTRTGGRRHDTAT